MEVSRIIAEIDAQIDKLQQARVLLADATVIKPGPGRPKKTAQAVAKPAGQTRAKRNLSPDARKRIAEAQKRRWAERRKASA